MISGNLDYVLIHLLSIVPFMIIVVVQGKKEGEKGSIKIYYY